jgi:PAT family beta-lactamase induction signal transducer AmpG
MGFSCGLPLLLTITVLQAWMKEEGVDLTVIGMMALVGLPYTLKFLWAPFLDRFTLPFLGRRRGWLLVAQFALIFSIVGLGFTDPGKNPWIVAFAAWKTFLIKSWVLVLLCMSTDTVWECFWLPGAG